MTTERFKARVGADIKEFQRKMKQIDREIRELASGVDVDFEAATAEFYAEMKAVKKELKGLDGREARVQVELAYLEFKRQMLELYTIAETMDDCDIDVEVDAAITMFRKKLLQAKALAQGLDGENVDVDVHLDTKVFYRHYLKIAASIAAIDAKDIWVKMKVNYREFQRTMGRIATFMRNWGEIIQTQMTGVFISLIPTLAPIIASLIGLIGSLGVMVGVVAGQLLIMASVISASAMAFAGLAAVAIPTISALFDETSQLTAAQQQAKDAFDGFVSVYDELVSKTEGAVLEAFTSAMQGATTILQSLEPLILSVADAAADLMESFQQAVNTEPIQAIFDAFNQFSADIFTNMVEGMGHFIAGIGSLLAALLPAGLQWSETFNGMMESFANWAAGLSESEKFQVFIAYVQEHMPLISQIISDFVVGLVDFFAAFGPLASEFMVWLADMAEKFQEWASTLGENQKFQEFLGSIRDVAPQVIELIGHLVDFFINLGIAMAPIGSVLLELVNGFLSWINSTMESSSVMSTLIGLIPFLVGGFMTLSPIISAITSLFGSKMVKAILAVIKNFGKTGSAITKLISSFMLIIDDIGRVISVVVKLASKALPWLVRGFSLLTGPIGLAIGIITTLIAIGIALYKNWDTISAWASKAWNKVKETISSAMSKVKESIQTKWKEAKSFLSSIDLVSIGKDIIRGLVNGISNGLGWVKEKVAGLGKLIPGWLKKVLGIHSPSRVMADVAKWIPAGVAKGIRDNLNVVKTATNEMKNKLIPDFSEVEKATKSQIASMNNALIRGAKNNDKYSALEETAQNLIDLYGMTAAQEADYWKQAASKLQNGSIAKIRALQKYDDAHARTLKNQYNREMDLIEAVQKYGTLSLRDQLLMYQQYRHQYKVGSEEQLAYEAVDYDTRKQIFDDLTQISDDYLKDVQNVYTKLADEEQKLRDEYQKTYEARVDTLANAYGLFDEVKLTDMSEVDIVGNMQDQVTNLSNWMRDLFRLEHFGLDANLLNELREMGPKAAGEIHALANLSASELAEYERLWQTKTELAGKQATHELAGARQDMANEIALLRENALSEIETLHKEMLAEVDKMINGTNDGFSILGKTLPEIGKEAMKGLIDGLHSMSGELAETAKQIATDATNSLSSILRGGTYNNHFDLSVPDASIRSHSTTNVDDPEDLSPEPVNLVLYQMWTGEEVETWIEERRSTNAKLNVKR